jgi:hypothetical protein
MWKEIMDAKYEKFPVVKLKPNPEFPVMAVYRSHHAWPQMQARVSER